MISLEVLGHGRLAQDLRAHAAPLGRVQISRGEAGAVLVDLPRGERAQAVVSALRAGKKVLCPPPVAQTEAELTAIAAAAHAGGGRLLPAGEIAHSEAGRRGLAAIAAPEFGTLRSLYLSIRQPRGAGDVLADLLPEALDPVLAAIPGPFRTIRVNAASLFGPTRDTAVVLLRAEAGTVVTIELSRCLPATLPAPGLGEVELDAMGTKRSIRIVPGASAVRVYRDEGTAAVPWVNAPVLAMLAALEAPEPEDGIARTARAYQVVRSVQAAA